MSRFETMAVSGFAGVVLASCVVACDGTYKTSAAEGRSNVSLTQAKTSIPPELSADVSVIAQSSQRLGSQLFANLSADGVSENLIIAPANIALLLTAATAGVEKDTAAELCKALGLALTDSSMKNVLAALSKHLDAYGDVNKADRYYVGMQIEENGKDVVRVKEVFAETPAANAGFRRGDRLISARTTNSVGEAVQIHTAADFLRIIDEASAVVRVRCRPDGADADVTRTLYLAGAKRRDNTTDGPPQYSTRSVLWHQDGQAPQPSYIDFLHDKRIAEVRKADFKKNVDEKVRTFLGDKVDVPREHFTEDLSAIYANAVSFKPNWSSTVQLGAPREMIYIFSGKKTRVPAFPLTGLFRVIKDADFQSVEIPCSGNLAVAFFLPNESDGLASFEKKLAAADVWSKLLGTGELQDVSLEVPHIDYQMLSNLRSHLGQLGMARLFPPIAPMEKPPEKKVDSDKDKKSDVDADKTKKSEEPVKKMKSAPNATFLQYVYLRIAPKDKKGAAANDPSTPSLRVSLNRPFLFVVYDRRTRLILILGRMVDPSETGR